MARDVSFTFDPFEIAGVDPDKISEEDKNAVLDDVADIVLTSVLKDTANGLSPVTGTRWAGLDPDYAKIKKKKGGTPIANLELEGDLLQAVRVEREGDTKLKIFVEADQSDKADGHNNHSGESKLPLRRFIPKEEDGEGFRTGIEKQIISTVSVLKEEEENLIEEESDFNKAIQALALGGLAISIVNNRANIQRVDLDEDEE